MKIFGDPKKVEEYGAAHSSATDVEGAVVVGYDPRLDQWLALKWNENDMIWLAGGGREKDESFAQTAVRELLEETGYSKFDEQVQLGGPIISYYFNDKKAVHRRSYSFAFLFLLDSSGAGAQQLEGHEDFSATWLDYDSLRQALEKTGGGVEHWLAVLARAHDYVVKEGIASF